MSVNENYIVKNDEYAVVNWGYWMYYFPNP
jgi:hypothetical protein